MSKLTKPYEISVWEDKIVDGVLSEIRIGVIGADTMTAQGRVLEPNLIRSANGTKKLSFKMYKKYIDTITGEKQENPFSNWLVAEKKVKLWYENKWYDFVVKDVIETSTDYLYRYSLEDALVQELSKNGFGVTFDAELMNNLGDAKELAAAALKETDWEVESEVFVQTVDEALVYVKLPDNVTGLNIYELTDQAEPYTEGVVETPFANKNSLNGKTVLAFYSCCKNKPHRFQFIYKDDDNPYGKNVDGTFRISRKDDRTINQANCQYFIEFDNPEASYTETIMDYGLSLPTGFGLGLVGQEYDKYGNPIGSDSQLSSWYRGARYGYAQQSIYVPALERYCQKFKRQESIPLTSDNLRLHQDGVNSISISNIVTSNNSIVSFAGSKEGQWSGYRIDIDYGSAHTYILSYELEVTGGTLYTIGGHNQSFYTDMTIKSNGNTYHTNESYWSFNKGITSGKITVSAKYNRYVPLTTDNSPYIFIQPNRGEIDPVQYNITNLSLKYDEDYLGYTESEFVSPTLLQNCINNYKFESIAGWTATSATKTTSDEKPKVTNVYGGFDSTGKFSTIAEDFINGVYTEGKTYTPYMKMELFTEDSFILNSGIRDNRTTIKNMPEGEEWVLDCKIVNDWGVEVTDDFSFSLGEYLYNSSSGGYVTRQGSITFSDPTITTDKHRIFTVMDSSYNEETFKKNSKIYLKIQSVDGSTGTYYIEKIALYRKVVGSDGVIIVPDLEETKATQNTFEETGKLESKYHYFSSWLVNNDNLSAIKEKDTLSTEVRSTLSYETYKPVYNEGAKKVRSIDIKESNYFNILQSISETFEAWLDLEIKREDPDNPGAVTKKIVKFKNYLGKDNYANFRYGVNLKDIQRTTSSKNIVTKLIVKQNSNELADNGFCTIQRAGANPTGESYIYDFQYYQNMGIMDVNDYLNTAYYLNNAIGPDAGLWPGQMQYNAENLPTNINGYYPRIKKINDELMPINEELIGLNADLLKKKAKLEVEQATYQASVSGIEQTREDFQALTGIYPEEAQTNAVDSIRLSSGNGLEPKGIIPKETWWEVTSTEIKDDIIKINIETSDTWGEQYGFEVKESQGITSLNTYTKSHKFTKASKYSGLEITNTWEPGRKYVLTYDIEAIETDDEEEKFSVIGCHNSHFNTSGDFSIRVQNSTGLQLTKNNSDSSRFVYGFKKGEKYSVIIRGTRAPSTFTSDQNENLWIQPNRGENTPITCIVSNIHLYKVLTGDETATAYDRTANFYINTYVTVGGNEPYLRTVLGSAAIPANKTTASIEQKITAIDLGRQDVQKYLTEYATYFEKRATSLEQSEALKTTIANKEGSIKTYEARQKNLLEYKKELNYLFFKKYSRFIQEGTWISEDYVDDDKYYADSQSVLYNSCYPQVSYSINVLALSALPGYEHFIYELGDKTNVIDEEFFGEDYQEEVIITEISEYLDDPSKNTIKVQNFKNQFQDLFQKITATVQQTQYNVGSYKKGAALVDANFAKQNEFITNAINNAQTYLAYGQTVETGPNGITITDDSDKQNQLRLVGGAILFSTIDESTQEPTWMTGLTNEGISANLITAGRLDAGVVQIMSGNDPVFRWDAYGISAYDALWTKADGISTISGINTKKFVRFDKHGIYGVDNISNIDGSNWHPNDIGQINDVATFALTWEGLKVTGTDKTTALLGKQKDYIFSVKDRNGDNTFTIGLDGTVSAKAIDVIQNTVEEFQDQMDEYQGLINNLQDQVDGSISTYFLQGEPTNTNEPANAWKSEEERNRHIGDLYYDTNTQYCYRWTYGTRAYKWELVRDTGITEAVQKAAQALDTAQTKMTVYSTWPDSPQTGDLLIPSNDFEQNSNQYIAGTIYKYDGKSWVPVLAEDARYDSFYKEWGQDKQSLEQAISGKINKTDVKIETSIDPITGLQTTTTTIGEQASTTYSSPNGNYVLTNVGIGNNKGVVGDFGYDTGYFEISTDGLMQANNAIIHGTIFANAGQIGRMTIGDINNKIVGKNLILNSANLSYDGITGNDPTTDNNDTWGVEYGYINVGPSYMNLPEGEEVVISFDLEMNIYRTSFNPKFDKNGNPTGEFYNNEPYLYIYNTNNKGPISFEGKVLYFYDIKAGETIKGRYYIKTKILHRTGNDVLADNYIEFYSHYTSNNYFRIKNLKLEKGTVATDWCPADEDNVSASVDGDFSWLFSPTEGVKMWNGPQIDGEEIFKIYKDAATEEHKLYISGDVRAQSFESSQIFNLFGKSWNGRIQFNEADMENGYNGGYSIDFYSQSRTRDLNVVDWYSSIYSTIQGDNLTDDSTRGLIVNLGVKKEKNGEVVDQNILQVQSDGVQTLKRIGTREYFSTIMSDYSLGLELGKSIVDNQRKFYLITPSCTTEESSRSLIIGSYYTKNGNVYTDEHYLIGNWIYQNSNSEFISLDKLLSVKEGKTGYVQLQANDYLIFKDGILIARKKNAGGYNAISLT